ncbi:MAG: DNA polymerase Y family protein [Chthoniobacteraceae bacterium]
MAIYVPDFALQCVLRREPEMRDRALAIVDGNLPARVRQMTPAARERAVTVGMTTTQALGRCPALLFRTPGTLDAESACLLQCAETFSPWLEATGEGVVTIEWRGEFEPQRRGGAEGEGGVKLGAKAIVDHLGLLAFTACVGIAATPDLALLAAHSAAPVRVVERAANFLAPLPLETLSADAAMCSDEVRTAREDAFRLLHRWGIHTLGEFTALPREQVVARLGGEAAKLWDRAAGRAERPLRLVRAPEVFAEAMELEHEVETLEPLLFILRRFLEQLAARLASAYRVAATLELRLSFATGAPYAHEFRIPAPTAEANVLFRILETHLETIRAEAPIIAVELHARPTRAEHKQFGLFESGLRDPNRFFETLARLQSLLGHDRIGTPVAEDTYRSDAFRLETPRFDEASSVVATEPPSGPALQRFRPPLRADVQARDGRPRHVFSEKAFGEITGCRGPWRSSGEWWSERTWSRIEWDIEVGEQLYRLAQEGDEWFLDGTYD